MTAHQLVIVVFDDVVCADFATALEVFGRVELPGGEPGYDVRICAETPHVNAGQVGLHVHHDLSELTLAQTVIIPGRSVIGSGVTDRVSRALKSAKRRGARMASICTGAFVLAECGLLDGLTATTHWAAADAFRQSHPSVILDANVLYVDQGQILTSAGASAGLDLCLHMIRADYGEAIAMAASRAAVAPLTRQGGQAQFIERQQPGSEGVLARLLDWAADNVTADLSVDALAERCHLTRRTLHRRFVAETGMTPAAWVLQLRIRQARVLLETTDLPIKTVAKRAGFNSVITFRDRFCQWVKVSPRDYRRSYQATT